MSRKEESVLIVPRGRDCVRFLQYPHENTSFLSTSITHRTSWFSSPFIYYIMLDLSLLLNVAEPHGIMPWGVIDLQMKTLNPNSSSLMYLMFNCALLSTYVYMI